MEGVIPPDEVGPLLRSVEATLADPDYVAGHSAFVNFNQDFARYLADPRVLGIAERMFGPAGSHTRVAATSANLQPPSGQPPPTPGEQLGSSSGFHADWPWSQSEHATVQGPRGLPDVTMDVQTFFMLSEFTEQNGATHIIPGSHRAAGNPNSQEDRYTRPRPTEMRVLGKAGSVFVFDNRLWVRTIACRRAPSLRFHTPWRCAAQGWPELLGR